MHIRVKILGGVIAAASLLAACQTGDPTKPEDRIVETGQDVVERDTRALTAPEIEVYLTDSTLSHVGSDRTWHVYLGRNGQLAGLSRSQTGALERARGTWSVRTDGVNAQICRQWDNDWAGGRSGCAKVYQDGGRFTFVPEGSTDPKGDGIVRTRTPGDSHKVL